jgi:hypothetical protein
MTRLGKDVTPSDVFTLFFLTLPIICPNDFETRISVYLENVTRTSADDFFFEKLTEK